MVTELAPCLRSRKAVVTGTGATRSVWISRTSGQDGTAYESAVLQRFDWSDRTASIADLEEAIGTELALQRRVVVLHGIDPDASLPESVQSLAGLPATATLPVACGIIERVQ